MPVKKFDYIVSPPDSRDYTFSAPVSNGSASELPDNSKLAAYRLPINRIEDQGQVGACTAYGVTSAFERLITVMTGDTSFQGSPMFNYTNSRILDADQLTDDDGTTLRSACSNLRLSGVCRDVTWPYTLANFSVTPSNKAYAEARNLAQLINYYEVNRTLNALKYIIGAYGYYVSIGFLVFPGFETDATNKTGDVPDPDVNTETPLGGHCVNLVGWDDSTQRFTFINQYGTSWGNGGLGTLSYNYVLNTALTPEIKVMLPNDNFISAYNAFKQQRQFNAIYAWFSLFLIALLIYLTFRYLRRKK